MARPVTDPDAPPTRERILDAAAETFAGAGFARATLAEIGRRAGISRPSLLYHFSSKDLLYTTVVQHAFHDLGAQLLAPTSGDVPARLVGMGLRFEAYLQAHPAHARIIVRELLAEGPGQQILTEQVAPLLDRVTALVEAEGQGYLRPGLPVRGAVLQIASSILVQAATPVRDALWAAPTHTESLIRHLFLMES